jgi:DNA-directed RNA polymerase specialized sigma subunit
MLTRKDVRLSDHTQEHQREILDELQQMIDEYEQQQQSIISIISSINELTKTEKDCRAYLFFRYAEGLTDDQITKVMNVSKDQLMRKRSKALLLFADAWNQHTDALTQASRTTYTKQ